MDQCSYFIKLLCIDIFLDDLNSHIAVQKGIFTIIVQSSMIPPRIFTST